MPELLIEKEHHVLHIVLNRPEVRNALNKNLLENLSRELDALVEDSQARAVIFSSTTDKVFCAGADLKERSSMSEAEAFNFVKLIQATFQKIALLEIPTIAAINGDAFGGGLELALACDMRISSPDVTMGLTECSLGIIPGAGGTQRLPHIIGLSRAMEMIFLAQRINGEEAHRIGLINHLVVQRNDVPIKAKKMAESIAQNAPLAIKAAKKAMIERSGVASESLAFERECYQKILKSQDRLEGLLAFKEKRPPRFMGI